MPINIEYAPRMDIAGDVAHAAGIGRYLQKQDIFQEGASQFDRGLAEKQRQFDVGLQEAAYQKAASRGQQRQQMALEHARAQQRMEQDAAYKQAYLQNQQQKRIADLYGDQMAAQQQALGDQLDWEEKTAASLDKQATDTMAAMAEMEFSPGGEVIAGPLRASYQAIRRSRSKLSPAQYDEVMGKWLDDVGESGLMEGKYEKHQPSLEEELDGGRLVTLPDGTIVIRQTDGDVITKSPVAPPDPPEVVARAAAKEEREVEAHKADLKIKEEEAFNKRYDAAQAALMAAHTGDEAGWAPSDSAILEEMRKRERAKKKFAELAEKEKGIEEFLSKFGDFPETPVPDATIDSPEKVKKADVGAVFNLMGVPHIKVSDSKVVPYAEFLGTRSTLKAWKEKSDAGS